MYKACSRCGKIHDTRYHCTHNKIYQVQTTEERQLRSTGKWKKKSLDIRTQAQYLCEVCRDQGRLTYEGVEVHHIEKIRARPDLLLDDNNLICLCVDHHRQAEAGVLNKDYLRTLAERRQKK